MHILAIESSCDDTAVALVAGDADKPRILANVISSQFTLHAPFGGIVPELASRSHIEAIWPVTQQALQEAKLELEAIDLIAVTQGPGLVGCLLVGLNFAKALALVHDIPCVGVDHLAAHLLAILLEEEAPAFPYIALVVSGGTSSIFAVQDPTTFHLLGRTRDDAAGEAFDKVAKLLGLGYPGGPAVSKLAQEGRADAIAFPRALRDGSLDFSFSGLKTAVAQYVRQQGDQVCKADICAAFEQAVVDVLVEKTLLAAQQTGYQRIVLGGGVAANRQVRQQMQARCSQAGYACFLPSPVLCTDNAAMIAVAGFFQHAAGQRLGLHADAFSRSPLN